MLIHVGLPPLEVRHLHRVIVQNALHIGYPDEKNQLHSQLYIISIHLFYLNNNVYAYIDCG